MSDWEPNDGPGPDGNHVITSECFACMVGVATGPESHGEGCGWSDPIDVDPLRPRRRCLCGHVAYDGAVAECSVHEVDR